MRNVVSSRAGRRLTELQPVGGVAGRRAGALLVGRRLAHAPCAGGGSEGARGRRGRGRGGVLTGGVRRRGVVGRVAEAVQRRAGRARRAGGPAQRAPRGPRRRGRVAGQRVAAAQSTGQAGPALLGRRRPVLTACSGRAARRPRSARARAPPPRTRRSRRAPRRPAPSTPRPADTRPRLRQSL